MDEAKQKVMDIIHAVARGDERYWMEARFIPRRVRWDVVEADLRQVFDGPQAEAITLATMHEAFAAAQEL